MPPPSTTANVFRPYPDALLILDSRYETVARDCNKVCASDVHRYAGGGRRFAQDRTTHFRNLTTRGYASLSMIVTNTRIPDRKENSMADRFEQLKTKYQSVLNFIQSQGVRLQNLNMEGDKLLIRASAPSLDLKNRVWDQIKLVDPSYSDLIADIQAPAAAAAAAGGASSTAAPRTYTVQPGDNLSKISKHFYGDANKYMKIFEANRDKLSDPDAIKPGTDLLIP